MTPRLNKYVPPRPVTLTVNGLLPTIDFQKAKCCAEDLHKKKPNIFNRPVINEMLEFDWSIWSEEMKRELRGETWSFNDHVAVFIDDQLLGDTKGFIQWAIENHNFEDFRNEVLYETLRKEAYAAHIAKNNNDFVYMQFSQEEKDLGKIVIELFKNYAPKTCENFRLLCTGELGRAEKTSTKLHYKDSIIHRVVPNGWVQGGDIITGKGNASESVYGGLFEDESFAVKHIKRGMVGMSNHGRHTNGSQFYITLQPAPYMDKQHVAFGRVVEGSKTLRHLEELHTLNERPVKECIITDCGQYKFEF